MANTIQANLSLSLVSGGLIVSVSPSSSATLIGGSHAAVFANSIRVIETTSTAVDFGDIGVQDSILGYVFFKNLDATNFVSISVVDPAVAGTSFCKLLPGEWCYVPTRRAMYAIANSAAVNLLILASEL